MIFKYFAFKRKETWANHSNIIVSTAVRCFKTRGVALAPAYTHALLYSHLTLTFTSLSIKLPREMSLCPASSGLFFLSFWTMVWYVSHSTLPALGWCTYILWTFSKCPTSFSSPPGKKAPDPFSAVSQHSIPTANLTGGKAGLSAPGGDDPHLSFTQPTATLTTSKEPMSNLRLDFHKAEPFVSVIPWHC